MENLSINIVDIILLVLAVLSGLLAALRGFVREFLTIGSWVGAIVVTIYAWEPALPYISQFIDIVWLATAASIGGIFLVTLVVFSYLNHYLSRGVKDSAVGALDRSLGFGFGIARIAFLACLMYYGALHLMTEGSKLPDMVTEARSYPYVKIGTQKILSLLPERYRSVLEDTADETRQTLEDASDMKNHYDRMNNLLPEGSGSGGQQPGYSEEERSRIEDLIQDNQ